MFFLKNSKNLIARQGNCRDGRGTETRGDPWFPFPFSLRLSLRVESKEDVVWFTGSLVIYRVVYKDLDRLYAMSASQRKQRGAVVKYRGINKIKIVFRERNRYACAAT